LYGKTPLSCKLLLLTALNAFWKSFVKFISIFPPGSDRDSPVGIATRYRLDAPGSNPGVGEIFHTRP
jgi:hypothetical protein